MVVCVCGYDDNANTSLVMLCVMQCVLCMESLNSPEWPGKSDIFQIVHTSQKHTTATTTGASWLKAMYQNVLNFLSGYELKT